MKKKDRNKYKASKGVINFHNANVLGTVFLATAITILIIVILHQRFINMLYDIRTTTYPLQARELLEMIVSFVMVGVDILSLYWLSYIIEMILRSWWHKER